VPVSCTDRTVCDTHATKSIIPGSQMEGLIMKTNAFPHWPVQKVRLRIESSEVCRFTTDDMTREYVIPEV
jgi:hypothetical protein